MLFSVSVPEMPAVPSIWKLTCEVGSPMSRDSRCHQRFPDPGINGLGEGKILTGNPWVFTIKYTVGLSGVNFPIIQFYPGNLGDKYGKTPWVFRKPRIMLDSSTNQAHQKYLWLVVKPKRISFQEILQSPMFH